MIKKVLCVFLAVIMVITVIPVVGFAADDSRSIMRNIDHYEYPITADSPDWFSYTVLEKVEMLKIPEDILKRMTDDALICAIEEYPYLCDIYVYGNSVNDGIETSISYFSALNELLSRDTAFDVLGDYVAELMVDRLSRGNEEMNVTNEENLFAQNALLDIAYSVRNRIVLERSLGYTLSSVGYVTTPSGSRVECIIFEETHTSREHSDYDAELCSVYGVELVSTGTCRYNCHSYAWYSTSPDNIYWMNNPDPYIADGSVSYVFSGSMNTPASQTGATWGDIVFYVDGNHSAILLDLSTTTYPFGEEICRSKWGMAGVFTHDMNNVPAAYNPGRVSVWRG